MKKGIIIVGKDSTKNLAKAYEIAKNQDEKQVAEILWNKKQFTDNRYFFNKCNEQTHTVIINEISNYNELPILFNNVAEGIVVDTMHKVAYLINPLIIILFNSEVTDLLNSYSLTRRFDIINN